MSVFFTDWTLTDPHYFYARGFVTGIVFTIVFIKAFKYYWGK